MSRPAPHRAGTSLARLDEGMLKPFPALSLLQRALQMGGIRGRTEQMHGFHFYGLLFGDQQPAKACS